MKADCIWKGDYTFENQIRQHRFIYDVAGPHGKDSGPSPKEALLSTICGCTGMDVASAAKKHSLPIESLKISAEAETTLTQPKIFRQINLVYEVALGQSATDAHLIHLLKSIEESMTTYCGVSAMIAPTSPMFYTVIVDGQTRATGRSAFPTEKN